MNTDIKKILFISESEMSLTAKNALLYSNSSLPFQQGVSEKCGQYYLESVSIEQFNKIYYNKHLDPSVTLVIVDIKSSNEALAEIASICDRSDVKLIATSSEKLKELYSCLLESGISRFLDFDDIKKLFKSQTEFSIIKDETSDRLKIALFEKNKITQLLIRSITSDFNIILNVSENLDDFFDHVSKGADFAIADIGSDLIDVPFFVKKALYIPSMLKTVFIPYAKAGALGISDINCGLNRLAKAVLSTSEVLRFLIYFFHKRELAQELMQVDRLKLVQESRAMLEEGFKVMYHRLGSDFFSPETSFSVLDAEKMQNRFINIYSAYEKVKPYLWIEELFNESITCGQGVYI